jgi:hypothetical protein
LSIIGDAARLVGIRLSIVVFCRAIFTPGSNEA